MMTWCLNCLERDTRIIGRKTRKRNDDFPVVMRTSVVEDKSTIYFFIFDVQCNAMAGTSIKKTRIRRINVKPAITAFDVSFSSSLNMFCINETQVSQKDIAMIKYKTANTAPTTNALKSRLRKNNTCCFSMFVGVYNSYLK